MASKPRRKNEFLNIRSLIAAGYDEKEIEDETGLSSDEVHQAVRDVLGAEQGRALALTPEALFTRLVIQTEDSLRGLDKIINQNMRTQPAAAVGAYKTKQQLFKDMISVGQSLGLVKKQADVRIGILVNASTEDLGNLLQAKVSEAQRLAALNGGHFLDVEVDEVHPSSRALAAPKPEPVMVSNVVVVDNVDEGVAPVVRRRAAPVK
jgi:hypothetical protein